MAIENPSKEEFNKLVGEHGLSFLQTWEWGEVKNPSWKPLRLVVDGIPVQVLLKKLPLFPKYFGYIPRGFSPKTINSKLLSELNKYLRLQVKLSHLIVEPNITEDLVSKEFENSGFIGGGVTIQPNYTSIINLKDGIAQVISNLKPQFRRDVNKARDLGVNLEIFEHGSEGLNRFYMIMESIFGRTRFVMHGYDYFRKVWEQLGSGKMVRIYIASHDGIDLGAIMVAFDSKGAYELYGGLTMEGKKMRIGPFLRIEAFEDIIKLGSEFYDQWGVAKFDETGFDKDHELYGISIFKKEMGGENVEFMPQQTVVYDKFYYGIYVLARWVNSLVIRLKKVFR